MSTNPRHLSQSDRDLVSRWFRVIAMLAAAPETFRPMITHRFPLQAALEGFELAKSRQASKVLLFP
jgi:threonine dehydrogenase-like Zn-dependent dehydrogenase